MSKENFLQFYRDAFLDKDLRDEFKAVTSMAETVKLGQRGGYNFSAADARAAMIAYGEEIAAVVRSARAQPAVKSAANTIVGYNYDFNIDEITGFDAIAREAAELKIKPTSVNLAAFDQLFKKEDLHSTELSPASAEFATINDDITTSLQTMPKPSGEAGYSQRDIHLINLDLNVEHPEYDAYFQRKVRMVRLLSEFFDADVKFSGGLWYPPNSYRLWHTNETQPGWRMYIVDYDKAPREDRAFFRFMNPKTKELVTLNERPRLVRFFRIASRAEGLFWHCIVNASASHRWSFGFVVPETWQSRLLQRS